jgi:hypothetical protein
MTPTGDARIVGDMGTIFAFATSARKISVDGMAITGTVQAVVAVVPD